MSKLVSQAYSKTETTVMMMMIKSITVVAAAEHVQSHTWKVTLGTIGKLMLPSLMY